MAGWVTRVNVTCGVAPDARTVWERAAELHSRVAAIHANGPQDEPRRHSQRRWVRRWRQRWGGRLAKIPTGEGMACDLLRCKASSHLIPRAISSRTLAKATCPCRETQRHHEIGIRGPLAPKKLDQRHLFPGPVWDPPGGSQIVPVLGEPTMTGDPIPGPKLGPQKSPTRSPLPGPGGTPWRSQSLRAGGFFA